MNEKVEVEVKSDNLITHDDFLGVSRRVHYNQFIGEFYERMATENEMPIGLSDGRVIYGLDPNLARKGKRVKECSRNWTFDFFKADNIKNLVRVDRCDDRFCLNCQALKADQRQAQYTSVLDEYTKTHDLYHVTFTVPNVDAEHLADTVELMFFMFGDRLIRFFSGSKKIRNVDFEKYGYAGAVRALEITTSKKNWTFHPHLHTVFILEKGLDMSKTYWNQFSEDRTGRNPIRLFSEFELLIQRIWCLLILREKVTKENIENIGAVTGYLDGFSCTADLANGDYHEIFKYAIKGTFKNETLFKYDTFLTLYKALYGRRCYQTYGVLSDYDFNDVDEELGLNSLDEAFDMFLSLLRANGGSVRIEEVLATILKNTLDEKCKYVSRATYTRHFRSLAEEEKKDLLEKLAKTIKEREVNHGEQMVIDAGIEA